MNTFNPDITIIVPMYNGLKYIKDSFSSVKNQSFNGNIELIVVNDGSTDNSLDLAFKLKKELDSLRFQVHIHNQTNHGIARTKYAAALMASSDRLLMLDQDDALTENAILSSVNAFDANPDAGIIYSNHLVVDGFGNMIRNSTKRAYDTIDFLTGFPLGHLKGFQRDILLKHYPNSLDYLVAEDFALCSSIVFSGCQIAHVNQTNYIYVVNGHNVTQTNNGLKQQYDEAREIIMLNFSKLGIHDIAFKEPPVRYNAPNAFTHYLDRQEVIALLGSSDHSVRKSPVQDFRTGNYASLQ
jgi:glycosyltransferase involved in cell wall biosynthesis